MIVISHFINFNLDIVKEKTKKVKEGKTLGRELFSTLYDV